MTFSYKGNRTKVIQTLRSLLHAKQIFIESKDLVARALDSFASGRGDFADYLIREQAGDGEANSLVATFDRALLKEEGFVEP